MLYWGITAFESEVGLDSLDYIRQNLLRDGKLELEKMIESLQKDDVRLPDVTDGQSHTSPMALAEIMMKFLDQDTEILDHEGEWVADGNKFSSVTSFTASKESIRWLRDYVSETLEHARENANRTAYVYGKWGDWFEEQDWLDWQWHMEKLTVRLDELMAYPENRIELVYDDNTIEMTSQTDAPTMGSPRL